jgi:CrcB protein
VKPTALLLVGAGGCLGAIARYLVAIVVANRLGTDWPFGTFIINISGCLVIGFFMTLVSERVVISDQWRLFFPVGFIGAYTTFSSYEYEIWRLVEVRALGRATSYIAASTIVGFVAVWLGAWAARRL